MPLVTRFADRGSFFRQALVPPNWLNGDLWVDTDNSNLAVNRSGTTVQTALGTFVQGDILHASTTDTLTRLAKGTADQVLTMNDAATLPNWETVAAVTSKLTVVETYEATSAESTHTFTITSDDFTDTAQYILSLDGMTSASMTLQMQFNGVSTSNYDDSGRTIDNGVETLINRNNQTFSIILPTINASFAFNVIIQYSDTDGSDNYLWANSVGVNGGSASIVLAHILETAQTDINEIKITGSSNWRVGTRMTLYKLAR